MSDGDKLGMALVLLAALALHGIAICFVIDDAHKSIIAAIREERTRDTVRSVDTPQD